MEESSFCVQKDTEGVALSGKKGLHQDGPLERPLRWRRRGNTGNTVNLSGKRTEYAVWNIFY